MKSVSEFDLTQFPIELRKMVDDWMVVVAANVEDVIYRWTGSRIRVEYGLREIE